MHNRNQFNSNIQAFRRIQKQHNKVLIFIVSNAYMYGVTASTFVFLLSLMSKMIEE